MGDTLEWWIGDGDWYDRKQQRAIQDLERSNAAARSNTRRLQKQVEQNQASLARRVDQLERALHAVVELEDVREELNEHVPAALVRRHARSVVMNVSGIGRTADVATIPDDPADVPGYWLAPAAQWAASLVQSTPNQEALDEACRRDPVRADLFVIALSGIVDVSIDRSAAMERLLAMPFVVTDWQRELWAAIAVGRFGRSVRSTLVDGLRSSAGDVTREQLKATMSTTAAAKKRGDAGHRLAGLAQRIATRRPTSENDAPDQLGDDTEPPTQRDDRLAELLAVIVEEGAPGEVAVLDSMADIRRVLESDAALQPPERRVIDQQVDAPLTLLLADFAGDDADLRDVAIDVLDSDLAAWARELHATAASDSAPTTAMTLFGQSLVIGADGVDESSWMGSVDAAHPVTPSPKFSMLGLVGALILLVGLLLVVIVGGLGVVMMLVGAGLAGWAGWSYWEQRSRALRSAGARNAARRRAARQVDVATKQVVTDTADFRVMSSTIDASLERILDRVGSKQHS